MTEAYGQRLGEALRVENAPSIVTRALRTADIAVTEIRCDNPLPEMCGPLQREDAFLVTLHLRDSPNREYWEDGRRASVCALRAGESCLHDLTPHTDWPLPRCRAARHRLRFLSGRSTRDAERDQPTPSPNPPARLDFPDTGKTERR
jgi:hypothetical protein